MIDQNNILKIYKQGWFLIITLFLVFSPHVSAQAAGQPTIILSPASQNVTVGANFQVNIIIDPNETPLDTARVVVSFPADKLQITSFTLGSLFPNSAPSNSNSIDNISGLLSEGAAIYNGQTSSAGTFGAISFKVLATGQATIITTSGCHLIKSGEDKTGSLVLTTSIITGQGSGVATQCSDGLDNDGDGKIDLADPGCANAEDNDEIDAVVQPATFQCNDGVDNDGDGKIDLADPGCASAQDNNETDTSPPQNQEQPPGEQQPPTPGEIPGQPEPPNQPGAQINPPGQGEQPPSGGQNQEPGSNLPPGQPSGQPAGGSSGGAGSSQEPANLVESSEQIIQKAQDIVANAVDVLKNITFEDVGRQVEKTVENTIEIAKVAQKATIGNPAVQKANEEVKMPALITTVATSAAAVATVGATSSLGVSIFTYGQFLISQFFVFFTRRKKKSWGLVYNSITKQPVDLAVVRVYEVATNRIIRTQVTDRQGRYQFILSPGRYRFTAAKVEFVFPCRLLNGSKVDGSHQDVYYGEEIDVKEKDVVDLPIPLDPERKPKDYKSLMRVYLLRRWQMFLTTFGVAVALASYIINPQRWVGILVIVQILTYFVLRKIVVGLKPKTWGVVRDVKNKASLSKAVVRVFDTTYNKLLDTQITDRHGRYAFLVGNQKYYMTGEKSGYHLEKTSVYDLVDKKSGFLVEDLYLKPHGFVAPPPVSVDQSLIAKPAEEKMANPPPLANPVLESPKIETLEVITPEIKDIAPKTEAPVNQINDTAVNKEEVEKVLNIGGLAEPGEDDKIKME